MIRYWFTFDFENYNNPPSGVLYGCGITAISKDDAMSILREKVFLNKIIPYISKVIENIDVSTLDANHVLPNMTHPLKRGVWFPLGYQ